MWFLVIPATIVYESLLGLFNTGSRAQRMLVLLAAAAALVLPFVLPLEPRPVRGFLGIGVAWCFLRQIDLATDDRPITPIRRALHGSMMMELRRTPRAPRRFDVPSFVRLLVMGAITFASGWVIAKIPSDAKGMLLLARGLAAVVMSVFSYDGFCAFARLLWSALGFQLPRLHDDPILSRTVAEFWGERWNRVVGIWLRTHCFMPLARRRHAVLGLVAAFVASSILHVYIAWTALDAQAALMWGIFFMAQIPIFLVERALRVSKWRPALARIWTVGVLLLVSPFFVLPVLRGFDFFR